MEREKNKNNYYEQLFNGVEIVIADIDNTLVRPKKGDFYLKYSYAVDIAVSKYLDVGLNEGTIVADFYRKRYGGGEHALFLGNIPDYFPSYKKTEINYDLLYDEMIKINPVDEFGIQTNTIELLAKIKELNIKIVALTDSPEDLSRRILDDSGINPGKDFDKYIAYGRVTGPQKIIRKDDIFREIANNLEVSPNKVLSIGDSLKTDILPPAKIGMRTLHIESAESYLNLCTYFIG